MLSSNSNEVDVSETNLTAVPGTGNPGSGIDSRVLNGELLDAVAQINFNNPVGMKYSLAQTPYIEGGDDVTNFSIMSGMRVPGIYALKFMPTFGVIRDSTDPVNTASNTIFGKALIKLSTTVTNIDPPDQFMYLMAVDSLAILFNLGIKIYLTLRPQSFENKYLQRHVIETMGFDYQSFLSNGSNLYFYLGKWASDLTQFVLPKDLTIVARHLALSSQLYKDSDLRRAQYYNFTPDGIWKYVSTDGKLVYRQIGAAGTLMKFDEFIALVDECIGAAAVDNGFLTIAALLSRIYTPQQLYRFKVIDQNAVIQPVYDENRILEIHNADILEYTSATGLEITQASDSNLNWQLRFDPTFVSADVGVGIKRQIDLFSNRVTSGQVLTAMKLKFAVQNLSLTKTGTTVTGSTFKLKTCGTEVVTNAFIRTLRLSDAKAYDFGIVQHPAIAMHPSTASGFYLSGFITTNIPDAFSRMCSVLMNSAFHGAPFIVPVETALDGNVAPCSALGDLNNYTDIDDNVLWKAQSAMLYDHLGLEAAKA